MILAPLIDLKSLNELAAGDGGTSNRRHQAVAAAEPDSEETHGRKLFTRGSRRIQKQKARCISVEIPSGSRSNLGASQAKTDCTLLQRVAVKPSVVLVN
jgi:hypothetical protein